jgi:hypothetical protein
VMVELKFEFNELPNHQLHTILNHLSKNHLIMICHSLKVRNVTNKRKSELQSIIHSDIYLYVKRYLTLMNESHITVLSELLFEEDPQKRMNLPIDQLTFFASLGITYPVLEHNIQTFIIPKEIKRFLLKLMDEELEALIKRNNQVIALAKACIKYYGYIQYQKFYHFYQQHHPNEELLYDIKDLLELESQFNHSFICEYDVFYSIVLKEDLNHLIEARKQIKWDYYPYELNQRHTNFIARQDVKIQLKLEKILKKFSIYKDRIESIFDSFDRGYTLDWIKENHAFEDKKWMKLIKQIERISPFLRLYCYKGNRMIDCIK